ncbi:MAG: hypothetical protein LBU83_09970 [Bacteroidales bacterium]|jgi:hypothetical protein|nr:hypothetical protein [Bacteroidales bacterium]
MIAKPSHNEHIGSMAALPPLENVCGIASLSPAGKYLETATAPNMLDRYLSFWDNAVRLGSEKNSAFLTAMVHFGKQT